MLIIELPGDELFDDDTQEFIDLDGVTLRLEHSLVSLSKWEEKFEKPFLTAEEKSADEALGYIEAMIMDEDSPADFLPRLTQDHVTAINAYIDRKMTATTFSEIVGGKRNGELITNELIYFWMSSYSIPSEYQHWHLNRLFTLIKVHSAKTGKQKKMSPQDAAHRQRELNAQRRAQMGTSG